MTSSATTPGTTSATSTGILEHLNVTVRDPDATAALLGRLFGWHVRWSGEAKLGGFTVHVGTDDQYLAIYSLDPDAANSPDSYRSIGGLNHIGVVVDDLDATEALILAEGLVTHTHADYEPGRRFYFDDPDGIEYEVASY
jgi:catechol 2,3-dioxygenase-like lactoylglutathione lyase family enzyme